MLRIFFSYILPLLLPALVYAAWLRWRGKDAAALPSLNDGPWFWLLAAGIVLAGAVVVTFALHNASVPGTVYEPAHLEGGVIVPGRMR